MRKNLSSHLIQHTPGHIECPACAQAHAVLYETLSPGLLFPEAFAIWMSHRTLETYGQRTNASYLAKKSERDYQVCARALECFFGRLRLEQIHTGHLLNYQNSRAINPPDREGHWRCMRNGRQRAKVETREEAEAWARAQGGGFDIVQTLWAYPAGANCIRKEVALLIRILKGARLWGEEDEEHFLRLRPVESDITHAMTLEQQHRFLHVGASRAEFRFMYQYSIVALQTTARTREMRSLRVGDVLLNNRFIQIPRAGAKNPGSFRGIPLVTEDAMWAMEGLLERARQLGSVLSSHYLFPAMKHKRGYDPTTPMSESGLKKPWDALRKAAGLPELRIYDLRHTGITRMAEAGVPMAVAMQFAGHLTEKMQRHYTAICMAASRGWGESVWGGGIGAMQQPWAGSSPAAQAWPQGKPVAAQRYPMTMPRMAR